MKLQPLALVTLLAFFVEATPITQLTISVKQTETADHPVRAQLTEICLKILLPEPNCPKGWDPKDLGDNVWTCCRKFESGSLTSAETGLDDIASTNGLTSSVAHYPACLLMCSPEKQFLNCPSSMEPVQRGGECWTCCTKDDVDDDSSSWVSLVKSSVFEL